MLDEEVPMKTELLEPGAEHQVVIFGKDSPLAKELEFLYRVTDHDGRSYKLYQGASRKVRWCAVAKPACISWLLGRT
jgi:hypothetical protein